MHNMNNTQHTPQPSPLLRRGGGRLPIWSGLVRLLPAFLTVVIIACLLLICERDFLWKAQELNLFLNTPLFFKEQMVVPGGLLTWLGTFFTQFFYIPWLGVTLLCVWWVLLSWLIRRTFQLSQGWTLLALVPILLLLVTIVDMGYWLYLLKLRGHIFVATIGATVVTALLWVFRLMTTKPLFGRDGGRLPLQWMEWGKLFLFPLLTCAVCYPLFGIYGLAATLLMAVWIWRLEPRKDRALIVTVTALLAVIFVPLLCYHYIYYQTNLSNIYFAQLPLYYIVEEYPTYYIPFYLLFLSYVVMALSPSSVLWKGWGRLIPAILLAATIVYAGRSWFRDDNFHRELAMLHATEQLDWNKVVELSTEQKDEPTRAIVLMRNIALAHLNRQASEMYHYPNGSKAYNAPFPMRLVLVAGPLAYYHYGLINPCYRLCTEMGVDFGWRAENLKYMAQCALLNGEYKLARKYINILSNTTFHKAWAERLAPLCDNQASKHELQTSNINDLPFVTHMMHYSDLLKSDQGYVEDFIMNRLANSTDTTDTIFQEQALLASLYTRDAKQFWRHLANYASLHPHKQLPLHIQEATIHFAAQRDRNIDQWPFDPNVRATFQRFLELTPQFQNMEVDKVRQALQPQFGKTYYYYYYLMDNLTQY